MKREVTFNALLPLDRSAEEEAGKPLKSLYLLHGYRGSHTDWISCSRIRELSDRYRIAVFMPAGENRFYLDDEEGETLIGQYIGRELVEFTRRTFPISQKQEDTFIGGLSMGGYGALRNGLKYAGTFGGIIALSSALITYQIGGMQPGHHNGIAGYGYYKSVFGELEQVLGSDKDPEELVRCLKKDGLSIPSIYMACGNEDFLLDVNQRFHQFLISENIEHIYKETEGAHTWEFWNDKIGDALEWVLNKQVE
jgi:S-formylglutathione hydrolase FrmB